MALRLPLPVPAVDVLLVVGGVRRRPARADRRPPCSTPTTTPTAWRSCQPGTPTNNTTPTRAGYQPRPRGDRSFAVEWRRERSGARQRRRRCTARRSASRLRRRSPRRPSATSSSRRGDGDRAVAGHLGLLPLADDRLRRHRPRRSRAGLGPRPRPSPPAPGRSAAGAALRSSALRRAAGHLARRLVGHRATTRSRLATCWCRCATRCGGRRPSRRRGSGAATIPSADLVDVLRGRPRCRGYRVRRLIGPHYLPHLRAFLGEDLDAVRLLAQPAGRSTGQRRPRVGLDVRARRWRTRPTRASPGRSPRRSWATRRTSPTCSPSPTPTTSPAVPDEALPLLQALLRHALLREYAEAAARVARRGRPRAAARRRAGRPRARQPPTPTWSWQRAQPRAGGSAADLAGGRRRHCAEVARLARRRRWPTPTPPTLERHLPPTLDATSYRLDAWVTSLAARRLAELRAAQPKGVRGRRLRLGREAAAATPRPAVTDLRRTSPGPLVAPADDPGFIHAPSLNQASAAALLRNAHLAHGGDADGPYAIELTSARVRLAEQLFDGVRQGQPLGALLGYDVERRLHEAGLDELIDDFRARRASARCVRRRRRCAGSRRRARARARSGRTTRTAVLAVAATRGTSARARRCSTGSMPRSTRPPTRVTAEGVFQMVRGNLARAATSLDAIVGGQAPPPDLGFLRTPRTGTGLTHRVALFVDADAEPNPAGWARVVLAARRRRARARRVGRPAARARDRRRLPVDELAARRRRDRDPRRAARRRSA